MADTLFADVSYFQPVVDDSYPHRVLSIRSNDGTFRDPHFAHNYRWCVEAVNSGRLEFFIVYVYVRPNWVETTQTHMDMITAEGGPHPRMVSMLDVESGGNPPGDGSDWINRTYWRIADWLGATKRVIGYANTGDFNSMWRTRPDGLRMIAAGYGRLPSLPGMVAHQYTDGMGYGDGLLPEGAPPFGNCDMNSANGLSPKEFAAACGIGTGGIMALTDDQQADLYQKVQDIWTQLRGPDGAGWPQLGQNAKGQNRTLVDGVGALLGAEGDGDGTQSTEK